MANNLARIEQFEKLTEEIDYYINHPTSFLYEHIEDPDIQEIVECTRAIALNNYAYVSKKKNDVTELKKTIENAKDIIESKEEKSIQSVIENEAEKKPKDLTELLELVIYSCLEEDYNKLLEKISKEDLKLLKFEVYKLIIETKKSIRLTIMNNPIADISTLQDNLNTYELVLEFMNNVKETEELEEDISNENYSNIVIAPKNQMTTYLYEDISEYPERIKEIKLIFEKIVDGYFLKTKDTKAIEGYQEKLYEYKHPNGIRILYLVSGNIITICSLFMKDKQKSTKIANEYDEAIKRYYESKEYITENFNNPDFHIEQAELVGKIFSLFDGIALSKKVGE